MVGVVVAVVVAVGVVVAVAVVVVVGVAVAVSEPFVLEQRQKKAAQPFVLTPKAPDKPRAPRRRTCISCGDLSNYTASWLFDWNDERGPMCMACDDAWWAQRFCALACASGHTYAAGCCHDLTAYFEEEER